MSTTAPIGIVDAAAPARYIKCEHRPLSGGTYRRVGGAASGPALCASLPLAPGIGPAAMPVFLFRRVGGALSGLALCAQPYFSATGKCACSVSSMPFRRVHPSSIGIQSDAALLFAAFFCSAPRSFPPGWKRAPPQPSAIKKSPFRALFLCIYQRALPSRTSTCVNEAYLPTPPLGFRRLAMS